MATATASPFAEAARARKVAALATTAAANGLTASMLERAGTAEWRTLAACAGVREPSAETRSRVLATLRAAEETQPVDRCAMCGHAVAADDTGWQKVYAGPVCLHCRQDIARYGCD